MDEDTRDQVVRAITVAPGERQKTEDLNTFLQNVEDCLSLARIAQSKNMPSEVRKHILNIAKLTFHWLLENGLPLPAAQTKQVALTSEQEMDAKLEKIMLKVLAIIVALAITLIIGIMIISQPPVLR